MDTAWSMVTKAMKHTLIISTLIPFIIKGLKALLFLNLKTLKFFKVLDQ